MRLPWAGEPAKGPRVRQLSIAGREIPVTIARHRLARRYVVRVSPDGGVRLTVPRGASLAGGFAFAARQADWIAREMDRHRLRHAPWSDGSRTWFRGELVPIGVAASRATIGSEVIPLRSPKDDVRAAVETRLRSLAAEELPRRVRAQSTLALGRLLARRPHHAQLAPDSDAAVSERLRDLPRARTRETPEPLTQILARSGTNVHVLAGGGEVAKETREGIASLEAGSWFTVHCSRFGFRRTVNRNHEP